MSQRRAGMRALCAAVLSALVLATLPAGAADAADGRITAKIDPVLLAEVRAAPNALFSVVARGVPSRGSALQPFPGQRARADTADEAELALRSAGGDLEESLSIVGAAAGWVTGAQVLQLANDRRIERVVQDVELVSLEDEPEEDDQTGSRRSAVGPRLVNAPAAWRAGLSGAGIGIAVLDSGVAAHPDLAGRVIASVDLTARRSRVSPTPLGDPGGHGTHVAGLIAGTGVRSGGTYAGVAPGADIVSVRVLDATGRARLSTVLHGLQWVLANRGNYHIRVANLSFGAPARSGYQADLLASATELLSFAGIVIVAAAGNAGAGTGTISTPGTDPFVLTVGAADARGSAEPRQVRIATWSSRGPTPFDALAKPDLVAPGRRMTSLRAAGSTLDVRYPDRRVAAGDAATSEYFTLSGTSMAAAIVSGAVALLLEGHPGLTPPQVKAQLRATAHPLAAASVFEQGAGLIDAFGAVSGPLAAVPPSRWRVSDAFALGAGPLLYGQPIFWRDLAFNNGVDARGVRWTDISWGNIAWNDISWQNISWESFTWTAISWETISWETISWENISWEVIAPPGSGGPGAWVLVD